MSLLDKKSNIKTDAIFSNKKDIELYDAELWESFQKEMVRQEEHIELIASENYASERVLQAQGSVLTNKYAEGYPDKRYYGGCEFVDIAERLAIEKDLFYDGPLDLSKIEAPKKDSKPFGGLYEEGDDGNLYNIFDGTPLPSNLMSKNIGPTDNGMFQKISNISTEDQTENVIIQPLLYIV